jgi:hypothetical protein
MYPASKKCIILIMLMRFANPNDPSSKVKKVVFEKTYKNKIYLIS